MKASMLKKSSDNVSVIVIMLPKYVEYLNKLRSNGMGLIRLQTMMDKTPKDMSDGELSDEFNQVVM